jgi:hypothetical protein
MISTGDKVTLKAAYSGYFKNLIGYELTVAKRIKRDASTDCDMLIVAEIDELHLLRLDNFNKVVNNAH